MKLKKVGLNKKQFLYEMALVLMLFYDVVLRQSNITKIMNVTILGNVVWGIVILLLILKMLITKYNLKNLIKILIVSLVCIASMFASGEITMIKFMFFSVAIIDIDLKRVVKIFISASILFYIIIVLGAIIGLIPNEILAVRYGMNRYNLGFVAPSSIGFISFNVFFFYLAYNYKKLKLKHIFYGIVILYVLWFVVNCKTALIANVFMLIMFLILRIKPRIFNLKILTLVPSIFGAVSTYLIINYQRNNVFYLFLDRLMSLRISLSNKYYSYVGIHLFGSSTDNELLENLWLDNAYAALLLRFGVISLLLIVIIYTIAIRKTIKQKNGVYTIGILCSCLYSLSETILYSFGFNIILFIVIYEFFESKKKLPISDKRMG